MGRFVDLRKVAMACVMHAGVVVGLLGVLVTAPTAYAQAARTWVSGVGDDVNPCSRTAPCKTFSGAGIKTALGGEVDALDPGGFGTLTITHALTIDGSGDLTSIDARGTLGITVSAGAGDVVVLRGLAINGMGSGNSGIRFVSGKALVLENVKISGFVNHGIDFQPAAGGQLFVSNADIRNVGGSGILAASSGGVANVTVDSSRIENASVGINARSNSRVGIRNTVVSNVTGVGLLSQSDAGTAELNAESVQSSLNLVGFQVGGTGTAATLRMSNVDVFDNTTGIAVGTNGTPYSFGDNRIAGNGSGNGSPPTLTLIPLQ
jgi:hypothetical protein